MKKLLLSATVFFLVLTGFSQQTGNYISATLKPGSKANSVYIVIKSNTTITGAKFSSLQFELGIPTTVTPKPGFTITSMDPLISYATDGAVETQNGVTYYGYGFSGDGGQGGSGTTYTAGIEYTMAEVFFTGNPAAASQVRLMQLPNGGTTHNVNFYVADRGFDVTNQTAQFYSDNPANVSNDGNGYSGSSFVFITNVALPVKLSTFTASAKNNHSLLAWSVENQDVNSSHFEIQRSADGSNFDNIGRGDATNNSQASYTYTDKNVSLSGTVYYRLKMVDKDGEVSYSDIKTVHLDKQSFAVRLYPNPVQSFTTITISLENTQPVNVSVNDALGKQIKQIHFAGQTGENERTLDLSTINSGTYLITIQVGNKIQTISIIKN
jgi:hypothetical protein